MAIFQVTNTISTLEKLPLKNGYIYYIANLDDLSNIMSHGISAISTDPKRSHAEPIYGKAISEYVSLYFNPRNAALYSAQKSYGSKVIILQIHKTALLADEVIFTNASATATRYECANELSDLLNTQFISWSEVMSKGWNHVNKSIEQSKRDKMMAEALVPTHLPVDMIAGVICQDSFIAKSIASDYSIAAVADMEYFFPIKLYAPQSKDELMGLICDEDIYLGNIDTSAITDMSELFYKIRREDFGGIESWDVSNVTDMYMMFSERDNFNQPLNNWDVSSEVWHDMGRCGTVLTLSRHLDKLRFPTDGCRLAGTCAIPTVQFFRRVLPFFIFRYVYQPLQDSRHLIRRFRYQPLVILVLQVLVG